VSKIQVAIDDAISCVHIPDGAYTRKGIILHLDHRKIDFDDTTRNPQLGLYGLSTEWDLLPLGLDCRYVDGLRARSDNGVLTLFARRTVQEGVGSSYRGTLTCEQGLMETLEFDLAEGLAGYIKYRMPIQTDRYDGQCNTVQPLREKALIKFHLRGSDAGFQCDAVEDNGGASVISVKPYDTPLASTQRIRSESRFADHKACEAKRLDLMARSKEDDPDNTGQYIEARLKLTRKISPDNASEKVIQRLDVEIYQLRFSATQIFTVKE
ncbi:MAG: hypothetical protein OEU26_22740, partial [Candidatus Tectomicrobia bacterium]|nr:hypothetical protein [Candidatus Tectomicrobia bacterium]